jgi:hypothetical protein
MEVEAEEPVEGGHAGEGGVLDQLSNGKPDVVHRAPGSWFVVRGSRFSGSFSWLDCCTQRFAAEPLPDRLERVVRPSGC